MDIPVIFSDNSFLVLDKPPNIAVDKSVTNTETTIEDILRQEFQIKLDRGGIVHRLDKNTSGVLVVAKTQEALEKLQLQFQNREVKKEYLTLVHGVLDEERLVEAPIGRNPENREKFTVLEDGKEARTKFEPEKSYMMSQEKMEQIFKGFNKIQFRKLSTVNYNLYTLVRAFPFTGRTHQIRVHLKYIGFSIVADDRYGGRKILRLDHRWCKRMFLHAAKISFKHPKSGKELSFESPIPEDLQQALNVLG